MQAANIANTHVVLVKTYSPQRETTYPSIINHHHNLQNESNFKRLRNIPYVCAVFCRLHRIIGESAHNKLPEKIDFPTSERKCPFYCGLLAGNGLPKTESKIKSHNRETFVGIEQGLGCCMKSVFLCLAKVTPQDARKVVTNISF